MDQYHHNVLFVASIMVSYKVAMIIKQITVFSPDARNYHSNTTAS